MLGQLRESEMTENENLTIRNQKPKYNLSFHNEDGNTVGTLDFNGPQMMFTGDSEASAKILFEYLASNFSERLEQERAAATKATAARCVEIFDNAIAQQKGLCCDNCNCQANCAHEFRAIPWDVQEALAAALKAKEEAEQRLHWCYTETMNHLVKPLMDYEKWKTAIGEAMKK
jgi:hypothetical protein